MNYLKARELARKLRKNQTATETIFWNNVRKKRLLGLKINRQFLIKYSFLKEMKDRYFIADFYCHEYRLIIEIDGKIHISQIEYDLQREQILKGLGYRIIRFSNDHVMYRWEEVVTEIEEFVNQ